MKKPSILHKDALDFYKLLWEIVKDDLEDGDEQLLAVLANTYQIHDMALEKLMDRNVVLAGETMVRQNPAFQVYKETEKMIESLSIHFGLSPKARKVIFKSKDEDSEDLVRDFKSKFGHS